MGIIERFRRWRHPKIWVTLLKFPSIEVVYLPYVKTENEAYVFEWDKPGRNLIILPWAQNWLWRYNKKTVSTPIIDYEARKSVNIDYDPEMYNIRSNPDLSGQLVDATPVKEAYQISPSIRKKIIVGAICVLIGYTIVGTIVYAIVQGLANVR
jgi:hypothetical protein